MKLGCLIGVGGLLMTSVVACGETSVRDDEPQGGAGSGGATTAVGGGGVETTAGAGGAMSSGGAGGQAVAGRGGGDSGGKGGIGGIGGGAGAGGHVGGGGAGGSGGAEVCTDLELVEEHPTCTPLADVPAAQGGVLVPGIYALHAYQLPICFAFEQTVSIEEASPGHYVVETVANVEARASATMTQSGSTLSMTSTCGATEVNEPYPYSVFEEDGQAFLRLIRAGEGVFDFRRVTP